MRRRDLLALLAGSAALGPRVARAKQRLVGVLWGTKGVPVESDAAIRRGLAEAGFVEGPDLAFAERYANNDYTRFPALAGELAALKPDVVVVSSSYGALALHRAAPDLPIVALLDGDPVAHGIFHSYARPEGMVTGLTAVVDSATVLDKNFEILRDVVPGLRGIGFMFRPDIPVMAHLEPVGRAAAQRLGLAFTAFPFRSMDEVKAAFSSRDVDAMYILTDALVAENRATFAELAIAAKKPVMTIVRSYTASGFLVSYGPDFAGIFRRLGGYAAKILAGAKPSDLPVEMPSKLMLVINLKTAKALGLTIPQSMLASADEVIE